MQSLSFVSSQHQIWHADALSRADARVIGTGHAQLDAQLPGGGWPVGALTEVLQATPAAHVWQLVLPALVRAVAQARGPVTLVGPPFEPFGPALAAHGLPAERLMWVCSQAPAARLWACEQALRCADVPAVLAWLPQARTAELRRLQLAAAQHEALLFVFRPDAAAASASPARLRLRLAVCAEDATLIEVDILKRRGPPLAAPVTMPAHGRCVAALLAASRLRRNAHRDGPAPEPGTAALPTLVRIEAWKHVDPRSGLDGGQQHGQDNGCEPAPPTDPARTPQDPHGTQDGPGANADAAAAESVESVETVDRSPHALDRVALAA